MDPSSGDSRRKHPRYALRNQVTVTDRATGQSLGVIANLSREGLMLVSSKPLPVDCIYQLVIAVDAGVIGNAQPVSLELGIDCLWNSPAANTTAAAYWSGCQIIDISAAHLGLLEKLLADAST